MPIFNVTIPDSSPLIRYDGAWSNTPKTNNDWTNYVNRTYHITSDDGATATFNFNGSAIYIFGAKRPGYGSYSVTLDDSLPQPASSATAKVDQFDSLLFAASSLDTLREHRVVLKNVSGPSQDSPIDIDYMLITAGNGDNQTISQITYVDQDDPRVSYSASWAVREDINYSGGSAELTYTQGASATVTFEGNAVSLYGNVNQDHALFSVSLDGITQSNFNGYASESRYHTLLYYASGLPYGQHTLKLTNIPLGNNTALSLDMISFESWMDSLATAANHLSTTASSAITEATTGDMPRSTSVTMPAKQHLHISAIVGAIVGAIGSIILFAVTLSFCYRRLRDTARLNGTEAQDVFRATPPTLPPTSCPIALPSTRPSTQFNYPCHDFTSGAASSDVVATTSQLLSINEDSPPPAYSQILPSRYTPLAVS